MSGEAKPRSRSQAARRRTASCKPAARQRPEAGDWGSMKFSQSIELYVADMRRYGRINSDRTEHSYRMRLENHGEDIGNRDPRTVGRNDIKRTLERWPHPNTQRHSHAILISFYDWAMEEGIRKDNPARQVRKAKKRSTSVYRLTREEVVRLLDACQTVRERRIMVIGLTAGARNQEFQGLRGEHFQRPGYIWFSPDIAKGGRERWVPVLAEAVGVVEHIQATVDLDAFIIPARRPSNPPWNTRWREYPDRPSSPQAIWRIVVEVAIRAGISAHIHPHLLRHAYGDHVAKYAGLRAAQALLGHVSVDTTASTYVDKPGLDELSISVHGFSYREATEGYPPAEPLESPAEATTGVEPV
jgi:integrase/recombinase XerC